MSIGLNNSLTLFNGGNVDIHESESERRTLSKVSITRHIRSVDARVA